MLKSLFHGREARPPQEPSEPPPADNPRAQAIKSPPMEIIGQVLTADAFVEYVEGLDVPAPAPNRVFLHHTWKPTPETWNGYSTILAMKAYYERQIWYDSQGRAREGWTVGPHVFVGPDGIWLFSDLRYDGVGVYGHNYRSRHVEMVGDYDAQLPSGSILEDTVAVLGILHERLGLSIDELPFHRDFSTKTCPGLAVRKPWIIALVREWIMRYRQRRASEMAAVRRTITQQVGHLLAPTNPTHALAKEGEARGLLGPISGEVPVEIEGQPYIVQYFAEALLAPAPTWEAAQSLHEYELARWGPPPAPGEPPPADTTPPPVLRPPDTGVARRDRSEEGTILDLPPTPEDPFSYEPGPIGPKEERGNGNV